MLHGHGGDWREFLSSLGKDLTSVDEEFAELIRSTYPFSRLT